MVKRSEFEQLLVNIIAPAVNKAQDEIERRWGFKIEVNVDWVITKGHLEDDTAVGRENFGG